jgi:hypothetical protein
MGKELKLLKQKVTETWKRLEAERVRERTRDRYFGQETVTKVSIKEAERIYDRNLGGDSGLFGSPLAKHVAKMKRQTDKAGRGGEIVAERKRLRDRGRQTEKRDNAWKGRETVAER